MDVPGARKDVNRRQLRLALAAGLVLSLSVCDGDASVQARCRSAPSSEQLSCQDAVVVAREVASEKSVRSAQGRVVAYLDRIGVSEGHSVSAWFVRFAEPLLGRGTMECPSTQFTVVLHASSGQLLAYDVPDCLRQ